MTISIMTHKKIEFLKPSLNFVSNQREIEITYSKAKHDNVFLEFINIHNNLEQSVCIENFQPARVLIRMEVPDELDVSMSACHHYQQ